MLVTTLLDHRRVSKDDLRQFYARRWNVELDLRNLKTTTGMYVLRCQTPQLNEKQLWVHLLAYNVIRLLMAQAASHAGVDPRELSFKHTVQLWTEWVARGLSAWAYRAENAKTKAKTLPLDENSKGARSQQSQAVRP